MDDAIKHIIESKVRRRKRQAPATELPPAVLDSFSADKLDVLRTFGIEAPTFSTPTPVTLKMHERWRTFLVWV